MVVQKYKGLGPEDIDQKEYFRFSKKYHLGDTQTYQRLTPAAAAYCDTSVQKLLNKWIKTYLEVLSKEERKFLCTELRLHEDTRGFLCLLLKVHI